MYSKLKQKIDYNIWKIKLKFKIIKFKLLGKL
jgi:hypothetical protein